MRNTLVQVGFAAVALLVLVSSAKAETRLCEGRRGVFSPDGARIAFECVRGGRLAVGVLPVSGGGAYHRTNSNRHHRQAYGVRRVHQ